MKNKKGIYSLLVVVLGVLCFAKPIAGKLSAFTKADKQEQTEQVATTDETDASAVKATGVEIPAPLKNKKELIIKHKAYTVSYNNDTKIPNWVAWVLTPARFVENYSRKSEKFLPDPTLPADEAVTTDDYRGSGWDRGHMCPANDNRWDWKAMQECFYMTNMCPQHNNLNRGDWKELEDACHKWAKEKGTIYIVCGPILYRQQHKTIGDHRVVVPEAFFKVVLSLGKHPEAIGFIYKNNSGNHPLDSYVNTVDEVETITGIDFFPSLPDNIEKKVESQSDINHWVIDKE
jgi:endonuclease G